MKNKNEKRREGKMFDTIINIDGKILIFEVPQYYDGNCDYYNREYDMYLRCLGDYQVMGQVWGLWACKGKLSSVAFDELVSN